MKIVFSCVRQCVTEGTMHYPGNAAQDIMPDKIEMTRKELIEEFKKGPGPEDHPASGVLNHFELDMDQAPQDIAELYRTVLGKNKRGRIVFKPEFVKEVPKVDRDGDVIKNAKGRELTVNVLKDGEDAFDFSPWDIKQEMDVVDDKPEKAKEGDEPPKYMDPAGAGDRSVPEKVFDENNTKDELVAECTRLEIPTSGKNKATLLADIHKKKG